MTDKEKILVMIESLLNETNYEPIEYTRTDAFIEKACEWLSRHFYDKEYEIRDDEGVWIDADCLIEDFEKYLKE